MTIETATYTPQLDATYPASGDAKSEGDNHIRLLKSAVKATERREATSGSLINMRAG